MVWQSRIAWSKGNSTFQFHVLSFHPQWKTPPQRTRKTVIWLPLLQQAFTVLFLFWGELLYIFFWCVWCPQDTIGFSARLGWSLADDECRDLPFNVWNWQLYIVWSMRHMRVKGSCLAMFLYFHDYEDYEALWRVGIVWRIKHVYNHQQNMVLISYQQWPYHHPLQSLANHGPLLSTPSDAVVWLFFRIWQHITRIPNK